MTAYLRVRAGKHFLTDVIAGYAVGATIGILVPHLHRNQSLNDNKNIRLDMGYNQLRLRWKISKSPVPLGKGKTKFNLLN